MQKVDVVDQVILEPIGAHRNQLKLLKAQVMQ